MSEYKLEHCTVNDNVGISKCKVSAFWGQDWWIVDFADKRPDALLNAMIGRVPHGILQDRETFRHQLVRHEPSGEVVAYARWILPKEAAGEWLDAQVPDVSDEDKDRFQKQYSEVVWKFDENNPETDSHIGGWRDTLSPPGPHMVLDYLCCRQDHQRKGVASMLLQAGLREADRLKLDVSIIVMGLAAVELYKKHGFEIKAQKQQSLQPHADSIYYTFWAVRNPQ